MSTLATPALSNYIAQQVINGQGVTFDEIIFCHIPDLNAENLAAHLEMPTSNQIVHRQAVSQVGFVNENAVVYSVTVGTEIGDFDFNYIALINRNLNLLGVAVYTNTIKKIKNKNSIQGNAITRSILLEFANAKQITNITIPAQTWQIDFTARLSGIDEKIRLTNRDLYGRAIFFDDGFLLSHKTGNQFSIHAGTAYIEGVRAYMENAQDISLSLPCKVYLDIVHHGTVTGAYQTEIQFLKQEKADYVDSAGHQHYVQVLADIASNGEVTDRRELNKKYIPTSAKSDATDSNSSDTVATSKAVKEVKELAESKQSPADTLAGYGITNFKVEQSEGNANDFKVDGNYYFASGQNLPDSNAWHIEVVSGGQADAVRQIARKANDTKIKTRFFNGSDWTNWESPSEQIKKELKNKADSAHTHTAIQITDFNQATNKLINAAFSYQKIDKYKIRKHPDGTLILSGKIKNKGYSGTENVTSLVFPVSFIDGDYDIFVSEVFRSNASGKGQYNWAFATPVDKSRANISTWYDGETMWQAIGRWK